MNASSITVASKNSTNKCTYFCNRERSAIANLTEIINEPRINIDNEGILLLQGSSTISAYNGRDYSELVLNLPTNAPKQGNSLLRVINDATFTYGNKIILAASSSVNYLQNETTINILTARKVTVTGSVEELLHSRVYDKNHKIITASGALSSSSILIKITNATVDYTHITANLQKATISTLTSNNFLVKIINSLLKNKIAKRVNDVIITADPIKNYTYITNNIDVGKNSQDIYAKKSEPAVVIISQGLRPAPTINKINITANVYGRSRDSSSFNKRAVLISDTNNMSIAGGIEVNSGCTIKGYYAIDLQDTLTTNFINRGKIYGIQSQGVAIYNLWHLNGNFENYGIVRNDVASIKDESAHPAASYEIHNHEGALIRGPMLTAAKKIINSGIMQGGIRIFYSHMTIENKISGKMDCNFLSLMRNASIALNNAGEITITGSGLVTINRGVTNSGTMVHITSYDSRYHQKARFGTISLDTLKLTGDITNSGYFKAGDIIIGGRLKNLASGNIQIDTGLRFEKEVENHGIINVNKYENDWIHFLTKVTNTGTISTPYGFGFDEGLDNGKTGKIALGYTPSHNSTIHVADENARFQG